MKVWGLIKIPQRIEFISYSPEYREQVLNVIRESFFRYETVSVGSEIDKSLAAQKDLEMLCEDVLERSNVSLLAKDIDADVVVGVALNVIQVKPTSTDTSSYFETFRDNHCKTENAKSLLNYMIAADSKVDLFERFNVNVLFEMTFLAVLKEYGGKGIGYNLTKYSLELAQAIKDNSKSLLRPHLASVLWTGTYSQKIGNKLGFKVIYEEPFANYSFNGKTFAERNGDPKLVYHLSAKRI